jgi:hypothetical protein
MIANEPPKQVEDIELETNDNTASVNEDHLVRGIPQSSSVMSFTDLENEDKIDHEIKKESTYSVRMLLRLFTPS